MFPDGYQRVFASKRYERAAKKAQAISEDYSCDTHLIRSDEDGWVVGVPALVYREICNSEIDGDDPGIHPQDQLSSMLAAGDISQAEFDEANAHWDTQRSNPDDRWSEDENLRDT